VTEPTNEPTHDTLTHGGLQERRDVLLATTREALAAGDVATLRLVLNSQHAVDLGDLLRRLDDGDRKHSLGLLAESLAAGVLAEFDASTLVGVAAQLDDRAFSGIVEQMAPDDATDVLADLCEEHSERILSLMAHGEARVVRELMKHPEDSGGGIMTSRLVSVAVDATVADAVDHLRARAGESAQEPPLVVFVVDVDDRFVGTVSLHRMLLAEGEESMGAIADREPITVRADMDQEEIAEIFADYDLLAMPVVDAHDTLVGQVTVDDIVDVIQEEATEDNLKMAATSSEEMEDRSVFGVMRHRLPWLLFCLLGTLLSGGVLDLFSGCWPH
jgi:magnesium transporter